MDYESLAQQRDQRKREREPKPLTGPIRLPAGLTTDESSDSARETYVFARRGRENARARARRRFDC